MQPFGLSLDELGFMPFNSDWNLFEWEWGSCSAQEEEEEEEEDILFAQVHDYLGSELFKRLTQTGSQIGIQTDTLWIPYLSCMICGGVIKHCIEF